MKLKNTEMIMQNKIFIWIAVATVIILMVPLTAMQFSSEVNWDETDFIVMGVLLFGISSLFVLAARKIRKHRIIIAIVFALVFLYIWAELSVGIFTNLGS